MSPNMASSKKLVFLQQIQEIHTRFLSAFWGSEDKYRISFVVLLFRAPSLRVLLLFLSKRTPILVLADNQICIGSWKLKLTYCSMLFIFTQLSHVSNSGYLC